MARYERFCRECSGDQVPFATRLSCRPSTPDRNLWFSLPIQPKSCVGLFPTVIAKRKPVVFGKSFGESLEPRLLPSQGSPVRRPQLSERDGQDFVQVEMVVALSRRQVPSDTGESIPNAVEVDDSAFDSEAGRDLTGPPTDPKNSL